ncbi:MAG: helix-turn-helix transcriptional regulator [Chloroflexota bacterium]|nr:helix-turn-helix transcriptional regulator [Chloroflexota bacterium]
MTAKRKAQHEWDAESIKALRQHMGMTQQEISEELGTRQQTVSEWETGKYRPRGGMSRLLTLVAERAGFVYETGQANYASSEDNDGEQEESTSLPD